MEPPAYSCGARGQAHMRSSASRVAGSCRKAGQPSGRQLCVWALPLVFVLGDWRHASPTSVEDSFCSHYLRPWLESSLCCTTQGAGQVDESWRDKQ